MGRVSLNHLKAVFLDRDGTISNNYGHSYIYKIEDFKLNNGVIEALKRLYNAGYLLFVITNQGGVAKGIYTKEDVEKVNKYMSDILKSNGIKLTKIYYCPHHPSVKACVCRKPSPFFVNKALETYMLDKNDCWYIGNNIADKICANDAGVKYIGIKRNSDINKAVDTILNENQPETIDLDLSIY